jgi:4-amino-4-deoxy-L-arabinose transferase-like glycosyltransferase
MAWSGVREKSTTFDEMAHLTAGYSYWLTGDYRLHPENGILPQRWETLPLLVQDVRFPEREQPHWWRSNVWELGYEFFYTLGNDLDRMLWWSRGMIVLAGVALGAVVYFWSRRLFGTPGAFVSLVLFAFSPTCLAHGRLATSDMAATLAFVASLGCLWTAAHRVSVATVTLSAAAMGLLFVCKMSAVLILPIGIALVAIRLLVGRPMIVIWRGRHIVRRRLPQLAVLAAVAAFHAVIVVATIWLFFGFRYETFREAEPGRDQMFSGETVDTLTHESTIGPIVRWANDHHLLPEAYLYGFAFTIKMSRARVAFLNGEFSIHGWASFFPYCFLVKTPLATFVVLLAAVAAMAARWHSNSEHRRQSVLNRWPMWRSFYRAAPILVFLAIYWAVAIATHLNIGHRHILPTYPLLFILCGAAGKWIDRRHKKAAVVVVLALAALVFESIAIYPHYLAYFNPLAGGPRYGYRHLVDSSLDWGQDLPGLNRWLAERRVPARIERPVYLSYFGTGSPEYYGIASQRLPSYADWRQKDLVPLRAGTYCVSATMLPSVFGPYAGPWTADFERRYWLVRQAIDEVAASEVDGGAAREQVLDDPQAAATLAEWKAELAEFDQLRFARLCAYLRLREPDHSVGYSILIYELDEHEVDLVVNRPLDEW